MVCASEYVIYRFRRPELAIVVCSSQLLCTCSYNHRYNLQQFIHHSMNWMNSYILWHIHIYTHLHSCMYNSFSGYKDICHPHKFINHLFTVYQFTTKEGTVYKRQTCTRHCPEYKKQLQKYVTWIKHTKNTILHIKHKSKKVATIL